MKSFGSISATAVLIAALFVLASCGRPGTSEDKVSSSADGGPTLAAIVLEVPSIFCTACWPRVEASARSIPGVKEVRFDKEIIQKVIVIYDPSRASPETIVAAIGSRGDKVASVARMAEP